MPGKKIQPRWGQTPWTIHFQPKNAVRKLPRVADFVVIGGGFTGLAAAAWLRHFSPEQSVVVLEAVRVGAGASGRTGGMAWPKPRLETSPGWATCWPVCGTRFGPSKLIAIWICVARGKLPGRITLAPPVRRSLGRIPEHCAS